LRLSWPLPVPDDLRLNSEDGYLLQYIISDEFLALQSVGFLRKLTEKFFAGFGGQLPSCSLRHALLALAVRYLPSASLENKLEDYKSMTYRELIRKDYDTVDDVDLLATFILLWIAEDPDLEDLHAKGVRSILAALTSNTARPSTLQTVFSLFRPLYVDTLYIIFPRDALISHQMIPSYAMSFRDRVECYSEIVDQEDKEVCIKAQFLHLFTIYVSMLKYLELSFQRTKNGLVGCDTSMESGISGIKATLKWAEYAILCEIYDTALGGVDINMEEIHPCVVAACILDLSVRFQLTLFDSISISQALQTLESIAAASKLVSFIERLESEWYFADMRGLQLFRFLGGLALSQSTGNDVSTVR
jgi:hypothetical protein